MEIHIRNWVCVLNHGIHHFLPISPHARRAVPPPPGVIFPGLMFSGLVFTTASVYQMLRGAQVVFCAILSIIFLNRQLDHYQKVPATPKHETLDDPSILRKTDGGIFRVEDGMLHSVLKVSPCRFYPLTYGGHPWRPHIFSMFLQENLVIFPQHHLFPQGTVSLKKIPSP